MFGKDKAQNKILNNLEDHFLKVHPTDATHLYPYIPSSPASAVTQTGCLIWQVHRQHQLPAGDFPDLERFRNTMLGHDLSKFPKLDSKMMELMDQACL